MGFYAKGLQPPEGGSCPTGSEPALLRFIDEQLPAVGKGRGPNVWTSNGGAKTKNADGSVVNPVEDPVSLYRGV